MISRQRIIRHLVAAACASILAFGSAQASSAANHGKATLENPQVIVSVDLKAGTFQAIDKRDGSVAIQDCVWEVAELKSSDDYVHTSKIADVSDALGKGKRMTVVGKKAGAHSLIMEITHYDARSCMVLNCGIINQSKEPIQVKTFSPLTGMAFEGARFERFRTLDGESGQFNTQVKTDDEKVSCHNSLLATFGEVGKRKRSLVFGGLSYAEFVKHATLERGDALSISLLGSDPVGKRVDAGQTYLFNKDSYYVDFCTDSPFAALETYGLALKEANHVVLDSITYPGLNFWYCSQDRWGEGAFKNTSVGTVDALAKVRETGFLNYTPLAIRLEPDDYARPNNQQGWWDDEHFRMYPSGKLEAPYDSIVKWGTAVQDGGGIPFIYCQTARVSLDYAQKFPGHMLFDVVERKRSAGQLKYGPKITTWGYDYTDPEFIAHMKDVYANYKAGGLKGMKFDYPGTGWPSEGGMDDRYATATSGYRQIFKLAFDGLGPDSDIHERLPLYGDVCLGTITTHRTEPDTDRYYPVMARKCGLRWYKNRVVVKYVNDVINPFHAYPFNSDGWRTMYTMSLLTNGRMEIGKYIEEMTDEMRHDLTRILPLYTAQKSARPVDAFAGKEYPEVFDFEVNPDWHIVTFYNTAIQKNAALAAKQWDSIPQETPTAFEVKKQKKRKGKKLKVQTNWPTYVHATARVVPISKNIDVSLSATIDDGGLGLNASKSYYVYDFWNQQFVGKLSGTATLEQPLRPGETRVMAVHTVQPNPQFISTDRHVMQGLVDFERVPEWNASARSLSGISNVIKDEVYTVVIALNGYAVEECSAQGAEATFTVTDAKQGIGKLTLLAKQNGAVAWNVRCKK